MTNFRSLIDIAERVVKMGTFGVKRPLNESLWPIIVLYVLYVVDPGQGLDVVGLGVPTLGSEVPALAVAQYSSIIPSLERFRSDICRMQLQGSGVRVTEYRLSPN